MSQNKTIQLNPIFLSGSAKAASLKREKKEKTTTQIRFFLQKLIKRSYIWCILIDEQ